MKTKTIAKDTDGIEFSGKIIFPENLGDIAIRGNLSAGAMEIGEGTTATVKKDEGDMGDVSVGSYIRMDGNLIVKNGGLSAGSISGKGKLSVENSSDVSIGGSVAVKSIFTKGNLSVEGSITTDDLWVEGTLTAKGSIEIEGGNMNVFGDTLVEGSLVVRDFVDIGGSLTAEGNISVGDDLDVRGTLTAEGNVEAGGAINENNQ